MLSQQTISTVKSTIPLLESAGPAITEHFYQRMFQHNPELKDIFNLTNQHSGRQQFALFSAVAAYAKYIDNLEVLTSAVERIAQKHASFHIQPEHYPIVGHHLIETLRELAPEAFNEEVERAWTEAFGFLAQVFIDREQQIYQQSERLAGGWSGARRFVISDKKAESELVTSFRLTPADGNPVSHYQPGQYLGIKVKPSQSPHVEIRQYSLSDRANGQSYRISVKREGGERPGLVSHFLHDELSVGSELELMPPAGDFQLHSKDSPVVMISAGVGITPMMAMLETLQATEKARQQHFLHACKSPSQHSFNQRLNELNSQSDALSYHYWYEDEQCEPQGQQANGLMQLAPLGGQLPLADGDFYLCGPLGFMSAIKEQLLDLGVAQERIHYEVFGPHSDL